VTGWIGWFAWVPWAAMWLWEVRQAKKDRVRLQAIADRWERVANKWEQNYLNALVLRR
jgi:hypothetical protein